MSKLKRPAWTERIKRRGGSAITATARPIPKKPGSPQTVLLNLQREGDGQMHRYLYRRSAAGVETVYLDGVLQEDFDWNAFLRGLWASSR